jgi:XTP/dITP diphosphohydrolase
MRLVFATNNKNKVKEIQALMPADIEILSLGEIGCHEDIPETQPTIEGNAIQKALYVTEHFGYDCFADDTGLEVEVLDGAPGVFSARYAGAHRDADDNMDKLLADLDGKSNRKARFKTVIALSLNKYLFTFTGICDGTITTTKKGTKGFGYDPLFQPAGYDQTFAQLNLEEKNRIGHRGKAINQLLTFLNARNQK